MTQTIFYIKFEGLFNDKLWVNWGQMGTICWGKV